MIFTWANGPPSSFADVRQATSQINNPDGPTTALSYNHRALGKDEEGAVSREGWGV